jgi:transcriptional regulator with XRE-family HTH domain
MTNIDDPVMVKIRLKVKSSGMTMQELGERMGYPVDTARKSVSQFLKGSDPRVGTVRKLAKALKIKLPDLLK